MNTRENKKRNEGRQKFRNKRQVRQVQVLFLFDFTVASRIVTAALAGPALLEAALGFCVGCKMFSGLIRLGVIPASVCAECSDITARLQAQSISKSSS